MSEKRTGRLRELLDRKPPRQVRPLANYYTQDHPAHREPEETYSPYPILGWRLWTLRTRRDGPFCDMCRTHHPTSAAAPALSGVYGKSWDGAYMKAECYCAIEHEIPEWDALCGIYAYKDSPYSYTQGSNRWNLPIVGVVALSDVIEHQAGYRAAEARILALSSTDPEDLAVLRHNYSTIDISRNPERLLRVWDYYSNFPDRIPPVQPPDLDERNQHGPDWKAPAAYTTDAGARDRAYYTQTALYGAKAITYSEARKAFRTISDA